MKKDARPSVRLEDIVSLAKRRGFIFPGSEIYGGLANSWDYGPLGVELKNNIKALWWKRFVQDRPDMFGLDSAILMHSPGMERGKYVPPPRPSRRRGHRTAHDSK